METQTDRPSATTVEFAQFLDLVAQNVCFFSVDIVCSFPFVLFIRRCSTGEFLILTSDRRASKDVLRYIGLHRCA